MPPDVLTFTVTVYNKGKRSKDTEVAELTVELTNLTNGDEVIVLTGYIINLKITMVVDNWHYYMKWL